MRKLKSRLGQGMVEFVVVLPMLLLLMVGVAEIGHFLRSYIIVANANREGARFAARGRFIDQPDRIYDRIVWAGGMVGDENFFLRTDGADANTGIIIRYRELNEEGEVEEDYNKNYVTGVYADEEDGVRDIMLDDSEVPITDVIARHSEDAVAIADAREDAGREARGNNIVIVEVFYLHRPLLIANFPIMPDPVLIHTSTEMRVVSDQLR